MRDLQQPRERRERERQKSNEQRKTTTTLHFRTARALCTCTTLLIHFFAVTARLPYATFHGERKHTRKSRKQWRKITTKLHFRSAHAHAPCTNIRLFSTCTFHCTSSLCDVSYTRRRIFLSFSVYELDLQAPIIIVETGDHLGIRPHFLTTGTDEL